MSIDVTEDTAAPLATEREFFEAHLKELFERFPGKVALVHGDNVAGIYDTELTALAEGAALFKKEPFLVRPIQLQNEEVSAPAYTLEILNCRS